MSRSRDLGRFLRLIAGGPGVLPSMDALESVLRSSSPRRVQTLNLHHLDLYERDEAFRDAMAGAGAWTADGWPVQLALRRLGAPSARVTGRELCDRLARDRSFAPTTTRIALLGATVDAGDRFEELLVSAGRTLVVRDHGAVADWRLESLAEAVRAADASLVLVAVSPPSGELVAARVAALLDKHACVVVGVGGAIDMAVGIRKAAPNAVSNSGLEWLWRLAQEPRRMASRYLRDGLPAFVRLYLAISRP
jgi:N-acetylglucosaminyldiphosphoundecaprenol N-acetyl-beta-D-mannosaminyltransferase